MLHKYNIAKNSDFVKIFDYSLQKPQAENIKFHKMPRQKQNALSGHCLLIEIRQPMRFFGYTTLCQNQTPSLDLLSISLSVKLWVAV